MRMFGREASGFPESIDLRNVVEDALVLMGEQLRLTDIELVMDLFQGSSIVLGHSIQMEKTILNFITNANDAIADRKGKLKITSRIFENDRVIHITLEVKGRGTPKDALPQIFEPFCTTKGIGKDRGLGLSVSYGVIRKRNGIIIFENINDGI